MNNILIQIFAKTPNPKTVKTRLSPALSPQQRCITHSWLVEQAVRNAQTYSSNIELWVTPTSEHPLFTTFQDKGIKLHIQPSLDLGGRMYTAINQGITRSKKVILVGSDCPFISAEYFANVSSILEHKSIAIIPATDGGYVLIAANTSLPSNVFNNIDWGTETVLEQTLANFEKMQLSYGLTTALADIDRPEDLALLSEFQDLQQALNANSNN